MLTVAKSALTHVAIIYEDCREYKTDGQEVDQYNHPPSFVIHGINVTTYKKWHSGIDFMKDLDKDTQASLEFSSPGTALIFTEMVKVKNKEPVGVNSNTLQFSWLKPEFKIHNNLNKKAFADEQVRGVDFPEDTLTVRFYSGNIV